ncbi:hypothetical protein F8R89_30915 [Streptomyces sp. SS1-1]|uniref:hypothetical protein n=1 Tax=Streptomyces sp. SS1-1 TaxID=2651869 RepID=UPI0012504597|nr:hypothetical protein [Streptomyces sp. SS1-1]KAB2976021.1 hypothetical protein F8R89_30915 [Streptomyces sp. SS1-1]
MKTTAAIKSRLTALTPLAILFTFVSLAWTGWSITDLVHSGAWGLLAAISVDGLWGTVQYLSYKGIGGRLVEAVEWITLGVACALLGWHGWTITPAAAFAGALPPIVAKIAWTGDIRLRRDPTALTAEQEAEINAVIRDSEYISRRRAAEIEREAAEEVALIRAQGKVAMERDDVTFQVELGRIRKREEIQRRTPLALSMSGIPDTQDTRPDTSGHSDSQSDTAPDTPPPTSKDTRPDTPDPLHQIAAAASGPADLVRTLSAHGVRQTDIVAEAIRLRPDMNPDSIRRTAKRLGEGPYL